LTLKLVATVSPNLALKPVARVSRFVAQNQHRRFGDLELKIIANDFLVWASKPSELRFVSCATKPMGG
jgi:hypothetical protein